MNKMGIFIAILALMFFLAHHNLYQKLYPNGVETKFIEVEENCSRILAEFAVPESIPSGTAKFFKKPENPSGLISQVYTTALTWEQIRRHYLDIRQNDGWRLTLDSTNSNYISLVKGSPHDRYAVDIQLKGNQCRITVGWIGLSETGK